MSKLIFTDLDFPTLTINHSVYAAEMANRELDKWLEETGVKVYSNHTRIWVNGKDEVSTHQAILVCVEEIKKECEHDNVVIQTVVGGIVTGKFTCVKCHQEVYPTGWVEV